MEIVHAAAGLEAIPQQPVTPVVRFDDRSPRSTERLGGLLALVGRQGIDERTTEITEITEITEQGSTQGFLNCT